MWSVVPVLLLPIVAVTSGGIVSSTLSRPESKYIVQHSRIALRERASANGKGVIVQMFEWNWDSVANECSDFLGPNGYRFVQVSPPQEHIQGLQWWTDYQPVSYQLVSKRGDRDAFIAMVQSCKAAGVGVIADTIWNHMTGQTSGTGVAGSKFAKYDYPDIYTDADFHHCGLEPGDTIVNYSNRQEVQTCELSGLSDLATETEHVRARLVQYTNDLLSLGVEGLRLDAAKHMAAADVLNLTERLSPKPFVTQEVIWGANEAVQPSEYLESGDVQEFRYTSTLRDAFLGSNGETVAGLQNLDNRGWIPSNQATVFVSNHDTERNGASLNANSPDNAYSLAHVFMLAHPYGTPSVLSSYAFTNTDAGAPNNGAGSCSSGADDDSDANGGWFCQHRWLTVAGMVSFWNAVGSESMVEWSTDSTGRVAFGRGASGFVAINNADAPWSTNLVTQLPAGRYCDVISGRVEGGRCTGVTYIVDSSHLLSATIPPRAALALHVGPASFTSNLGEGAKTKIVFEVEAQTVFGENIFLVGSLAELGEWDTSRAIPLSAATYPTWTGTVTLPPSAAFEYKYVRKESDGSIVWESDPNRRSNAPVESTTMLHDAWR